MGQGRCVVKAAELKFPGKESILLHWMAAVSPASLVGVLANAVPADATFLCDVIYSLPSISQLSECNLDLA
jgi:hypothetical protein